MIHLTLAAPSVTDLALLVHYLRDQYATVPMRLSLHVKPNRAQAAYELVQRFVPDCRLLVTWSEPEAIVASSVSWPSESCAWCPVTDDRATWPLVGDVYDLVAYQQVAETARKRPILACCAGYRWPELLVADGHQYQTIDIPLGMIAYSRGMLSSIVSAGSKLTKVPRAHWVLAFSLAIARRVPACIVPSGQCNETVERHDLERVLALAREAGWKSRVQDGE